MKRILMLLITMVLMIGAAVPDADARGYHRPRRHHRNTRSGRRRNPRARVFSRFGSFTHGSFSEFGDFTAEQKQIFFKNDRRETEAYLRELRAKERARRRRK